jgi:hypothetical protein
MPVNPKMGDMILYRKESGNCSDGCYFPLETPVPNIDPHY